MKRTHKLLHAALCFFLISCAPDKVTEKGFQTGPTEEDNDRNEVGMAKDSVNMLTQPGGMLLTGVAKYRLTPIYKVNYTKDGEPFTGSNDLFYTYKEIDNSYGESSASFMPGISAAYGYNMVNLSHFDTELRKQKNFFSKPVLIKTVYFPSFAQDSLHLQPINRNYFMVSVYTDDTNKDGFLNLKDLRHLYYFDGNGENRKTLVPENYSVMRSEYDSGNDYMYVYSRLDKNNNGTGEETEPMHVFWIDLKNPENNGKLY